MATLRFGKVEKRILLTLLAFEPKPLSMLDIHGFSNPTCASAGIGHYLSGDYPGAQMYQATERLYHKGLVQASEGRGKLRVVLTEEGWREAIRIYENMARDVDPWVGLLVTLDKKFGGE